MRKKILISGATGQVGQELAALSQTFPELELFFAGRRDLDLMDPELTGQNQPPCLKETYDWYLHTAAYTAVDQAEKEEEDCFQINARSVGPLARFMQKRGTRFVYLSTDYVYHSGMDTPYTEEDPIRPQGVYARSKRAGEEAVLANDPNALVFRTSWVYGAYGHNFVRTMDRLGQERQQLSVVSDQIGSPTWSGDLARMLLTMIKEDRAADASGIFNYANEGACSWCDLAEEVMKLRGHPAKVIPIYTKDYPHSAPRPPYSVMDKTQFKRKMGLDIPHWRESLTRCLQLFPKLNR